MIKFNKNSLIDFISPLFDLYSDYLPLNQGPTTATVLAALLEGKLSHDAMTRSLAQQDCASRQLWQVLKPFVEQTADARSVLTLNDTVEPKPYRNANPLIRHHQDHCQQAAIQGISQLLYSTQHTALPVAYELIKKDQLLVDPETRRADRYGLPLNSYVSIYLTRRTATRLLLNSLVDHASE